MRRWTSSFRTPFARFSGSADEHLPALKAREGSGIMSDAELLYTFLESFE
jgi:hypothetical protein